MKLDDTDIDNPEDNQTCSECGKTFSSLSSGLCRRCFEIERADYLHDRERDDRSEHEVLDRANPKQELYDRFNA